MVFKLIVTITKSISLYLSGRKSLKFVRRSYVADNTENKYYKLEST